MYIQFSAFYQNQKTTNKNSEQRSQIRNIELETNLGFVTAYYIHLRVASNILHVDLLIVKISCSFSLACSQYFDAVALLR